MGNYSVYLANLQKKKLDKICQECDVYPSTVMRLVMHALSEDYIKQIILKYKKDLLIKKDKQTLSSG